MIPKRAIFFWEGEEMSWLRKQSIETFRLLNPSWEIAIIGGSGLPIEGVSRLDCVLRSDWARYRALYATGGVYFDTDIVFCKPIPDSWLEKDMILTMGPNRVVEHIAVLGCEPGNTWFQLLDEACAKTKRADGVYNYQFFGTQLIGTMTQSLAGRKIKWLTPEMFIQFQWDQTEKVWTHDGYLSPLAYGVHWFGGDWLSISFESQASTEWAKASSSLVAKALREAWSQSEAEVHREHHGL